MSAVRMGILMVIFITAAWRADAAGPAVISVAFDLVPPVHGER